MTMTEAPIESTDETPSGPKGWVSVLTAEGVQTGDHRKIAPDALDWRDLPLTLMLQTTTPQGGMGGNPHAGAVAAARIDEIERLTTAEDVANSAIAQALGLTAEDVADRRLIVGKGVFDSGVDGVEALRMVGEGIIRGVSVDLTNVTAEAQCFEEDAEGNCVDGCDLFTAGRIMGATITPFQAIEPATIALAASVFTPGARIALVDENGQALTAIPPDARPRIEVSFAASDSSDEAWPVAVAPLVPPVEWFQDPGLTKPTPLTITPEGRIYGHLAQWGQCHLGFVNQAFNKCVTVPASKTGYALFTKPGGQLAQCCGDCAPEEVTVGSLVLGTTHADLSLPWKYANEFYENTGKVAAHVVMGEDAIGPWFSGALNPGLSAEDVWTLRGAKVSGDWRKYGGGLELTSILCVNTPGFPVGAPKVGFSESGEMLALVASLSPAQDEQFAPGPSWADFNVLRNQLESLTARLTSAEAVTEVFSDDAADRIERAAWGDIPRSI